MRVPTSSSSFSVTLDDQNKLRRTSFFRMSVSVFKAKGLTISTGTGRYSKASSKYVAYGGGGVVLVTVDDEVVRL